jgi:hypothetical protein
MPSFFGNRVTIRAVVERGKRLLARLRRPARRR